MAGPKRHHFVPRAFLERFGCDGKVAVRWRTRSKLVVTSALNVAVESGFYTTETPDGGHSTEVEEWLAGIDGPADAAIKAVIEGEAPPRVGSAEREILAVYMAIQANRTPETRERLRFPVEVIKYAGARAIDTALVAEYLEKVHLGFSASAGEVRGALTMIQVSQQMGHLTRNEEVTLPMRSVDKSMSALLNRHWSLEIARKPRLLTSDAPLVMWSKPTPASRYRGIGLTNAEEIRFPIGAGHQLVLGNQPRPPSIRIEPDRVRRCNDDVAAGCHKFIVGHPRRPKQMHEIQLAAKRPTIRFNEAPGYRTGLDGEDEFIGDILHYWIQRAAPAAPRGRQRHHRQ
ncbi:Protein of unknown function [Amycolatopsis xylanica]|uniref:DUF4238 domain-containing protein n=1 Tax=Amycolatopsis xylanica TaxID=589385 RepID=A0A1H3S4N4_9PSEU|nr:DUF4238 domain-containing protein [Amycolatopsis xylanica]SDZ32099.1 Protein of unknown function [Amycolatopsis xylanica]